MCLTTGHREVGEAGQRDIVGFNNAVGNLGKSFTEFHEVFDFSLCLLTLVSPVGGAEMPGRLREAGRHRL